jgi:hypothetical protein
VVDFYKYVKGFLILLVALAMPSIKFSKDKRSYDKKVHVKGITGKRSRLSKNVAFISQIMDAGVDFIACDQPHVSRFTLDILATVAEHEARIISKRTKATLAAYKKRGGLWGGRNLGITPVYR